MMAYFSSSYKN